MNELDGDIVLLVYLWTRDANIPPDAIEDYVMKVLPGTAQYFSYDDEKRLEAVKASLGVYSRANVKARSSGEGLIIGSDAKLFREKGNG